MRFPVNPRLMYMLPMDDSNVVNAFLVRKNTPTPPPLVRFSKEISRALNILPSPFSIVFQVYVLQLTLGLLQ